MAGRYRLLAEVGRGAMGRVWRAHDELLDRQVAVKELRIPYELGPEREELLGRTLREARLTARLSHPRIAAVYDVVVADERPWIVLQFVPAPSLAQLIAERGPLPVASVARIGLEMLDALRAAHAGGIVHRDIKPANILITDDRHAMLTDFGLASTLDDQGRRTQEGIVVGTPAYIAPERARGGPATPQADLWSLGATLYAAVEGRAPFGLSSELATLSAVLTSAPEPFEHAGPLAPIITGLLEKDPDRRTDADRAYEQLSALCASPILPVSLDAPTLDGDSGRITASSGDRPFGKGTPFRQRATEHWRQAAAVAALIVSVLATASWWSGEPGAPRPTTVAQPTPSPATLAPDTTALQAREVVAQRHAGRREPEPARTTPSVSTQAAGASHAPATKTKTEPTKTEATKTPKAKTKDVKTKNVKVKKAKVKKHGAK
ncbi:serine/threonine-protein kinase [Nonomuraea sp. NPDC049695]|uniref:serine/threonine-protein kinase n=1 Tax=Nonomuraea sp. NPDC049695 TaxID=3154734 RepID=UPI003414E922